jgi:DUF1009 family protein
MERGGSVHIVAIEGEADADIERYPHTWVNWGQVGRMVSTLRKRADAMVIAGGVRRPDLWKLRPDWGFLVNLPRILEMMAGGGDDSVLSRVVRFFEAKGITVRGAHEVAPGLLALRGPAGALALDAGAQADAELGFAVRTALGPLDAGQAVVVGDGKVLAIEGAEGTDAMLRRVADLRGARDGASPGGVLAKGPKPAQELRVDMPTIGPRTVEGAAAAGLAGVAIEAGAVLLLDRAEAVAAADARGIAVEGLIFVRSPAGKLDLALEQGAGGRVSSPPSRRFLFRSAGVPVRRRRFQRSVSWGEVPRDSGVGVDIEKGLAAIERLARFDTGKAVVVSRAYILSIAAADSIFDMLERTRALRQWGVGARRRVGVAVCRADAAKWDAESAALLIEKAAAAGLACVAVTGPAAALAPFADAGSLADRHDLVLATREEHP